MHEFSSIGRDAGKGKICRIRSEGERDRQTEVVFGVYLYVCMYHCMSVHEHSIEDCFQENKEKEKGG